MFLLLVALILWISRTRFDRVSVPLGTRSTVWWLVLTTLIALCYYWLGSYTHHGFLKHLPAGVQPEWLRRYGNAAVTAAGGLIFSWLLLSMMAALRPQRKADAILADQDSLVQSIKKRQLNAMISVRFWRGCGSGSRRWKHP